MNTPRFVMLTEIETGGDGEVYGNKMTVIVNVDAIEKVRPAPGWAYDPSEPRLWITMRDSGFLCRGSLEAFYDFLKPYRLDKEIIEE